MTRTNRSEVVRRTQVYAFVRHVPASTAREIATHLGLSSSRIAQLLRRLEAERIVVSRVAWRGRRVLHWSIVQDLGAAA